jgi:two-component system chemotaxis sensor kinase CheA
LPCCPDPGAVDASRADGTANRDADSNFRARAGILPEPGDLMPGSEKPVDATPSLAAPPFATPPFATPPFTTPPFAMPGFDADELLAEFLLEGRELVQLATEDLLALDRDAADASRIDSALRAFHTLKGSAGLFDFAPLGRMLHAAEDLLITLRDATLQEAAGPVETAGRHTGIIDPLLQCIGVVEAWLGSIGRTGLLPADAEAETARLTAALAAPLSRNGAAPQAARAQGAPDWLPALLARHAGIIAGKTTPLIAFRYIPAPDCFFRGDDPLALLRSVAGLVALDIDPPASWPQPLDPFTCHLRITGIAAAPRDDLAAVFRFVSDQVVFTEVDAVTPANSVAPTVLQSGRASSWQQSDLAPSSQPAGGSAEDGTARFIRVDAGKIDALVDIAGELIVAKNSLAQIGAELAATNPALARTLGASRAEIDRLVSNMHRSIMAVRMTSLARIFRRLPRLVREAAASLGKTVDFTITGEDVEADKSIVDALFEPLLHVLRNAVDHGIEPAAIRTEAGKPPAGRILLAAGRQTDRIVLTITDDGAGIDAAKIRSVAAQRQVSSAAALAAMDEPTLQNLIFAPGFSTASETTALSGRGVGMDAVRNAVQALGGTVSLSSTPGAGTTIRLVLPQAVLITTIVTVRAGDEVFGVPLDAIMQTARVARADIHPVPGGEALVLRGRTIPLLRLAALLGRAAGHGNCAADGAAGGDGLAHSHASADTRVLIAACGHEQVAIAVDAIGERIDVLLRPLAGMLSGVAGVIGAALLGDGSVLMVLDLPELAG